MTSTVLVTGTSTGFGKATALQFAREGWNVVATMRTPRIDDDLAMPNVLVTKLDVEERTSIDAAVRAALDRFGAIDVLVNNAGFGLFGIFEATSREKIQEQFDVNVFGVMDVTRAVLPQMRERRRGVIINVSSGAGVFTLPMSSSYSASKFALEGWSEGLSYELLAQNIVVKILEPGGVVSTNFGRRSADEAERSPALPDYAAFVARTNEVYAELRGARLATAEDVARAIFAAATDGSRRLRYVATADIEPLVAARRETSEDEYIAFMRGKFLRG